MKKIFNKDYILKILNKYNVINIVGFMNNSIIKNAHDQLIDPDNVQIDEYNVTKLLVDISSIPKISRTLIQWFNTQTEPNLKIHNWINILVRSTYVNLSPACYICAIVILNRLKNKNVIKLTEKNIVHYYWLSLICATKYCEEYNMFIIKYWSDLGLSSININDYNSHIFGILQHIDYNLYISIDEFTKILEEIKFCNIITKPPPNFFEIIQNIEKNQSNLCCGNHKRMPNLIMSACKQLELIKNEQPCEPNTILIHKTPLNIAFDNNILMNIIKIIENNINSEYWKFETSFIIDIPLLKNDMICSAKKISKFINDHISIRTFIFFNKHHIDIYRKYYNDTFLF